MFCLLPTFQGILALQHLSGETDVYFLRVSHTDGFYYPFCWVPSICSVSCLRWNNRFYRLAHLDSGKVWPEGWNCSGVSLSWKRVKHSMPWIISGYKAWQCSGKSKKTCMVRSCVSGKGKNSSHMLFLASQVGLQLQLFKPGRTCNLQPELLPVQRNKAVTRNQADSSVIIREFLTAGDFQLT